MFTAQTRILALVIISLVLGACTPDTAPSANSGQAVPATIPPTRTLTATETGTGTAVAQPSSTATPTLTVIITPEVTRIPPSQTTPRDESIRVPTVTLRPTVSPQSAVTTDPDHYDIPAWVSDPEVNVLLFNQDSKATLFNPQTGEQYDMPGESGYSLRWIQHDDGIYIRLGSSVAWDATTWSAKEINIATGQINYLEGTRELTPTPVPPIPSPDGRYLARIARSDGTPDIVYIIDQDSGEEKELANPFDGQYSEISDIKWSPDGKMLAIERIESIEDPDAFMGWRTISAVTVYSDIGIKLGQNVDVVGRGIEWSSISPYNLLHAKYGLDTYSPCIFEPNTTSFTCLDQIVAWREQQEVETYNYKWSPDGSKVGFIYWTESSEGGFCYVELVSTAITCPIVTEDFQVDEYLEQFPRDGIPRLLHVQDYDWSPDGKYIVLLVDPEPPGSDDGGQEAVAVIDSAGGILQLFIDGWHWFNYPWRPPLPVPSEE